MSGSSQVARRFARVLFAVLIGALLVRGALAAPKVDAESQRVLDAFGKFYAAAKGFGVTVNIDMSLEQQGKTQTIQFVQKFAAERPNKLSYLYEGASGGASVVSDGKDLSVAVKGLPKYAVEVAPETWADFFKNPFVQGILSMGNAAPVTAAILDDDPAKRLVTTSDVVEYGGLVDLGEVKCHLIKASGSEMDWQMWIDAGKEPLVRQFVPDLAKAFEKMAKAQGGASPLAGMKVSNIVSYHDWEIDPKFAADAFAFTAPEGATRVDSLMEAFTGGRRPDDEPAPHALLGQPAPQVNLELLDGGKLDLASYKNKNIVILDFWATWCGPCVRAMPIIEKVAEKYKDKGVLLYAVNIQEMPDEIQAFLKAAELKVNVALDKEGATAAAYLAEAIPQTVVVGKDGSVQVVMVGVGPDLEEKLTKDLESLVAGKDLASETLAKAKAKTDAAGKAEEESPDADASKDGAGK